MNEQTAPGICNSFMCSVLFTQKLQVAIADASAGKMLKAFVHVNSAHAVKRAVKPTAHHALPAQRFCPL